MSDCLYVCLFFFYHICIFLLHILAGSSCFGYTINFVFKKVICTCPVLNMQCVCFFNQISYNIQFIKHYEIKCHIKYCSCTSFFRSRLTQNHFLLSISLYRSCLTMFSCLSEHALYMLKTVTASLHMHSLRTKFYDSESFYDFIHPIYCRIC